MKMATTSGKTNRRRRGILTLEWILLISLLVIGVIGGLSSVRNALICELNDLTECIESIACCDDDASPEAPAGLNYAGLESYGDW